VATIAAPDAPNPALAAQAAILARPLDDPRRMANAIRALAIDGVEQA
jgi:transketolase